MSDYGSCWCCSQYGIVTPAVSTIGLCRPCGGRSPSACKTVHEAVVRGQRLKEAQG